MAASYGLPLEFTSDQAPSRHEKSLGLLTTKFVTLLQEAKDGVLDLKVVSDDFIEDVFVLNFGNIPLSSLWGRFFSDFNKNTKIYV